jgi:hypothetical protein
LKIIVFYKFLVLDRAWKIGKLENWNIEMTSFKKMTFLYLISFKKNFTITQLSILSLCRELSEPEAHNPTLQYSSIPLFQ